MSESPRVTFPVLDTLRLVGALGVLTTHTAFWAGAYTAHPVSGPLLARLDVGVALFFVLSGFLLSREWLASRAEGRDGPRVGRFWWRRVLRIVPLYLVTTAIALAFLHDNRDLDVGARVAAWTMTSIYSQPTLPAGLTHMWSLTTEVAFYLVLPLAMLLVLGRRRGRLPVRRVLLLVLAMAALSIVWLGVLSSKLPAAGHLPVNEWLPAFTGWFGLGIALALADVVLRRGDAPGWLRRTADRVAAQPGVCWALAGGLLLVAATPLAGPTMLVAPTSTEGLVKNLLYAAIGVLVVATGVFTDPDSRYHRWASHRLLRHLGHTSYGTFCIHLPVLHLVMWLTGFDLFGGHFAAIWGLTLVLALAAAEVLYRVVERPSMRLRDLGRRPAATSTAARVTTTR